MRLSSLNIWKTRRDRHAQQQSEVVENSSKRPVRIWKQWEHKFWGDNIALSDWDNRRIYGHTTPLPRKNDILHVRMQSGKTAAFRFASVEYCGDPSDMWFATVKDMGYVE